MRQYNSISKVLKELLLKTKDTIFSNLSGFLLLNLTVITILILYTFSHHWITQHLPLYNITLSMIALRITLFCFWSGIAIGLMKILMNYINNNKVQLRHLFNYYYLLPNILSFISLVYIIWMIPISYIIYKFPYNAVKYGTNLSLYLEDIQMKLINILNNEIDKNLVSAYFNEGDMLIISLLGIIYYIFIIKYWSTLFFIVEKETNLIDGIKLSSHTQQKISHILILGFLTSFCIISTALFQNIILLSLIFTFVMIVWGHYFKLLSTKK